MKPSTPEQQINRLKREVAALRSRLNRGTKETYRVALTRVASPGIYFLGSVDAARTMRHLVEVKRDGSGLILEAVRREPA